MAMTEIEKIESIFAGIRAGDPDLATQYIDQQRFVQHNQLVADGVDGLKEFIRQTPSDKRQEKIIRVLRDSTYVVTQSTTEPSAQDISFNIFRFQDGRIGEQWAFSADGAAPNQSGYTQTDGPTQPKAAEDTEKNKAFVRNYYQTVHISRDERNMLQYFDGDRCIRHEPGVRDGVANFLSDLHRLIKNRTIDEIKFVLGRGDFVFIAATGTHAGNPCVYIDLYRVEDGKLAERWGFSEAVPPHEELKNKNGML